MGNATGTLKFKTSFWYIPHFIFYFLAFLTEMFIKASNPLFNYKLNYSLRAIASFTASVLLFNRLRADIHIDYEPLFDEKKSLEQSGKWYNKWYQEYMQN